MMFRRASSRPTPPRYEKLPNPVTKRQGAATHYKKSSRRSSTCDISVRTVLDKVASIGAGVMAIQP